MKEVILKASEPETIEECKSMRNCWNCSIYLKTAQGDDFFDCFNVEKMKQNIEEIYLCF